MKKMLSILLTMLMLLGTVPAMADAEIKNPMPKEMADLFDVPAWEGYELLNERQSWTYDEEQEAGVVIMSNGSLHVVCIVEPDKNGNLRITQRNYTMVVGDNGCSYLGGGYGNTAQEIDLPWGFKPGFELCTGGYDFFFAKFDGVWRIKVVINSNDQMLSFVFDDRIGYRVGEDTGEYIDWEHNKMKYAYGTYDNRFAAFNIYAFPKTLEEARNALTNPPVTPSDFYSPLSFTLRPREKYDVFAAPGRSSLRSGNGKGVMSTNDWVQIFGEEDGWVLVQYDISSEQMRFGYVDVSVLPKDADVPSLTWYDLPEQTIKANTYVTDDPLCSRNSICWLNAGDTVKMLSSFGQWYYIETTDASGRLLRGFVLQSYIDIVTDDELLG